MKLITQFTLKSLAIFGKATSWMQHLLSSIADAAKSISYVETMNPTQADSLHLSIKNTDEQSLQRAFETCVRKVIPHLPVKNVSLGVDGTEEPYWGKNGGLNTRASIYETSRESWQYLNIAIVHPYFIPLMSIPYDRTRSLDDLVIELLEYARTLPLVITLVLFDRGFYHAHLIDYLESKQGKKSWSYLMLVPKTKAVKRYIAATNTSMSVFTHAMEYAYEKSTWEVKTKIIVYHTGEKDRYGNRIDWCFATNQKPSIILIQNYKKRWNIETGFRIHDEARIKSKSSHPRIRYFYHLVSMIFILMWRLHNHFERHIAFKRYLKTLEQSLLTAPFNWEDPPQA